MELKKRDCPVKMRLIPYGSGWTDVYVDFGDGEIYFIISYALGNSFSDLIQSLYLLHPDNDGFNENFDCIEYKQGIIEKRGDDYVLTRVVGMDDRPEPPYSYRYIPWKASFIWDEEGTDSEWVIERVPDEKKSFQLKITIDVNRAKSKHYEYNVDYADMCYAVSDACTKALKKHGFNGYHSSSYTEDMNLRHLLFLKAVALNNMDACKVNRYQEKGKGDTSDFNKEIELLLFDM